jgi:transposase-like protein
VSLGQRDMKQYNVVIEIGKLVNKLRIKCPVCGEVELIYHIYRFDPRPIKPRQTLRCHNCNYEFGDEAI